MHSGVKAEQPKINLVKISKCLDVGTKLASDLIKNIVPVVGKMIKCVDFRPEINVRRINIAQLMIIIYQFVKATMGGDKLSCLIDTYLSFSAIAASPSMELDSLKCSYLFVEEPSC